MTISVKVWDPSWRLQLVFVGHDRAVTSLAMFPYGPMVMSASLDCTMRVWSFETCDEVDLYVSRCVCFVWSLSWILRDTFAICRFEIQFV